MNWGPRSKGPKSHGAPIRILVLGKKKTRNYEYASTITNPKKPGDHSSSKIQKK